MTTLWNLPESANKTALTNAAKARQARERKTSEDSARDRYIAALRKFDGGRKWTDADYYQLAD